VVDQFADTVEGRADRASPVLSPSRPSVSVLAPRPWSRDVIVTRVVIERLDEEEARSGMTDAWPGSARRTTKRADFACRCW
jgi:hypothetical protein